MRPKIILTALLIGLLLLAPGLARAAAPARPVWWAQAQKEAARNHYRLIGLPELKNILSSNRDFVLLDVRPSYEYAGGHLPGAQNLEFHLGDRSRLSPSKAASLEKLLGPDKKRLVIIYCRSYQ